MIIQIIQLLLISLGFNTNNNYYNQPRTLHREPIQQQQIRINNPIQLAIIFIAAIIIFTVFVFLFMPGNESGVVYNQFNQII